MSDNLHSLIHNIRNVYYCTEARLQTQYMKRKPINPQMPKVFRQPKTPKGGWMQPPWIFAFPSEFFENISYGYVFGVKKSNGDNEFF